MDPLFQFSPFGFIQILASFAACFAGWLMWKKRSRSPSAFYLSVTLLAAAWWSAMGGLELCSVSLQAKILYSQLSYLGIMLSPFYLWRFAYGYINNGAKPPLWLNTCIWVFVVLTLVLTFTNGQHHLVWSDVYLVTFNGLPNAFYARGPWFWCNVLFCYVLVFTVSVMLLSHAMSSSKEVRVQNWTTALAMFFPWVLSLVYILRVPFVGEVDNTPIGFVATGVLLSWNVLHFGLFDLVIFAGNTLLECMPDPVFVVDNSGRLAMANPAACSRFSLSWDESSNRPIDKALSQHPALLAAFHQAKSNDKVPCNEGGAWWEVLSSSLSDASGRHLGRLHVLRETTALKRALELASENECLAQKASEAKSLFVAQVSHDLRTPMHAILGTLDLLQDSEGSLAHSAELSTIREAGDSLLRLVNGLLDLSRIESGRVDLQNKPFRLAEVLEPTVDMLRVIAQKKGISLTCSIAPGFDDPMEGDPDRLRQILVNVAGNAVKFTSQGGVGIQARVCEQDTQKYQIIVQDSGPGIREEMIPKLFSAFERGDREQAALHEGTGLGLAISKRLVNAMQGSITVHSELGKGTAFEIVLPLKPSIQQPGAENERLPANKAEPLVVQQRQRGHLLQVLLADDDRLSCRVSAAMLKKCGCEVDAVEDGTSVLRQMQLKRYDAIVLDGFMPGLNGWETSRRIMEEAAPQGHRPIIIAISADLSSQAVVHWKDSGASVILPKPLSQLELRQVLEGLFPMPPAMPEDSEKA
jgi:signal transduction histidine kinase